MTRGRILCDLVPGNSFSVHRSVHLDATRRLAHNAPVKKGHYARRYACSTLRWSTSSCIPHPFAIHVCAFPGRVYKSDAGRHDAPDLWDTCSTENVTERCRVDTSCQRVYFLYLSLKWHPLRKRNYQWTRLISILAIRTDFIRRLWHLWLSDIRVCYKDISRCKNIEGNALIKI